MSQGFEIDGKVTELPDGILRGEMHNAVPMEPADTAEIAALRAIVQGTARSTGTAFFENLVQHLAEALGVAYAFVAEFADSQARLRTLAVWVHGEIVPNQEFDTQDTPCREVVDGTLCYYPSGLANTYPNESVLANKLESYIGVPLSAASGEHLGHLAIADTRPMPSEARRLFTFRIFAARAAAELERLRAEKRLLESEQRYRDLYDEAPIAYVHEAIDSRFISANRAAQRILGIKPEEVQGTYGRSFIPDTPEARKRFDEALASVGKGTDTSGVVLELRRKDNGKPVWIQWWSKPDPSGTSTRTMLVDITERVLIEQEKNRLSDQNVYLQEEIKSVHNFEEIVGRSPAMFEVFEKVNRVAKTDSTVLITGETGTGKELIARAIHSNGNRRNKPLIKVNCAALPPSLIESELFGHEKGAFSGATSRRIGRFELAAGGTLFLDEVGEMPLDVQVKFLRVLQEHEFERVGGATPIKADVRVIAATNRDLLKAIGAGHFRSDLFYRLNVFPIAVPPLRDRRGDVRLLAQFLLGKLAAKVGKHVDAISDQTMQRLNSYHWPGNVRELENVIERAIILSNHSTLEIDSDVFAIAPEPSADYALSTAAKVSAAGPRGANETFPPGSLESVERNHILSALKQTQWVIDGPHGAAQLLNIHPNTLRSRLKKLGLQRPTS